MTTKVIHLTSVHPLLDTRIFIRECGSLVMKNYQVVLCCQHNQNEEIENIKILPLRKTTNRLLRMTYTALQVYCYAIKENAYIYHFHDPELIFVGLLLKLQGKKVIYDIHEDVPRDILSRDYIPMFLKPVISWCIEQLENMSAKFFDAVVTATPVINKRFSRLGVKAVNVNNYPLLSEFMDCECDWSKKEPVVCYVGSIARERGIFEMVDAIGLTNSKLLLAGTFSDTNQHEQAKARPGWCNVIEMGQSNRKQVADIFSKSMAGLVVLHPEPNHINSQPNKLFEYMAAGIPVIASDFPLWRSIIKEAECGLLVNPLNPVEIAKAIEWILTHPTESQLMGSNGKRILYQKYNWDNEFSKLHQLYKDLIV